MQIDQLVQALAIGAIPILFAITLHEAAHGYVARHFGDSTAERAGRLSLNPIRHIDPIGTVLLPIVLLLVTSGQFMFGWAKPVPVNFGALRQPKKDMLWVALAGPAANLAMALGWALLAKLATAVEGTYFAAPLFAMAAAGIRINVVFMVLNLIPIPPLDGGRIAVSLLPHPLALRFARIEPYGMFILVILLITQVLGLILWPLVHGAIVAIQLVFGL